MLLCNHLKITSFHATIHYISNHKTMTDCIICKIINNEIPGYKVYEDDSLLAFLDIKPRAKGHTVVVLKRHAPTVEDLTEEEVKVLFATVKKVAAKLKVTLKPDGFSIGWNNGSAAGQVVPHLHVHIMPRWNGDGGGNMHTIVNNPGDVSVADLAKMFK